MTHYDEFDYIEHDRKVSQRRRQERFHRFQSDMIDNANEAAEMQELEKAYRDDPIRFMEMMEFRGQLAREGADAYIQEMNSTGQEKIQEESEKPKGIARFIPGFGQTINVKSQPVD